MLIKATEDGSRPCPRSSLMLSTLARRRPSGSRHGVEICLSSHHPTRRMKFNAVAAGFFTSQPSSGDISKFPQKMRRFISKSLAKNKDFSQPYFIFQRVFSGLTGRFVFQMPGALKASTTSWFWCMVATAMIEKESAKNQISPVTPSGQSYPNTTARQRDPS